MIISRSKSTRGASLIDVLFGTSLLAVTVSGATIGLNMATNRALRTQERAALVAALQREIETRTALAQMGALTAGTTTVSESIGRKNYTLTLTTASSASAGNPNVMQITAAGTSTAPLSETVTLTTLAHNKPIGEVISLHYSPSVSPSSALLTTTNAGYGVGFYIQKRWNALQTATSSEVLVDSLNAITTMKVSVSPSTVTLNSMSTSLMGSDNKCVFEGNIEDSANSKQIAVSLANIPYSSYNVVVYFGESDTDPIEPGWIELNGVKRIPIQRMDWATYPGYSAYFLPHRNYVVLGPLSGSDQSIKIIGTTKALRFHGLQVAKR